MEIIRTKIGNLKIKSNDGVIYESSFTDEVCTNNHLFEKNMNDYLNGVTQDIPFKYTMNGTNFQNLVWNEIIKIPYGTTKTYGEIAKLINCPNSYRAVANACGKNQLIMLIPCHRVIGTTSIGGYKWGCYKKLQLLNLESEK